MSDTPEAANRREEQFFEKARETGVVWCLQLGNGWFNFSDDGSNVIPIWSDVETARKCAQLSCPQYQPASVSVKEFTEHYLPQLSQQDVWLAINPTEDLCDNQRPAKELGNFLGNIESVTKQFKKTLKVRLDFLRREGARPSHAARALPLCSVAC